MMMTFFVIRPANALLRLGILSGILGLGLLATDRVQASGVALFVALLSLALAALTWVLWTLGEVLVYLAGLGVLLHRVIRFLVWAGRSLVAGAWALVGIALLFVGVTLA